MNVNNKVIVVSGGGSGIGRELVLQLIHKGARVAAADLNEQALNETAGLLDPDSRKRLSLHVLNIADQSAVEAFPSQVMAQHTQVDGIINNAGIIQPFVRVNDLPYDAIHRVMNVNFFGTLYMTKSFLPHLLKRPEAQVVNISSMGGFLPVPGQSVYGAAKAAVKLLTEGLQSELDGTGLRVMVVFPGAVATNIMNNSGVEATKGMEAASKQSKIKPLPAAIAAKMIINGMESNKKRLFVGNDSRMLDILYRISPTYATALITRQMKNLLP